MDLFEEFVLGYCECILWAEVDGETGEPLDTNATVDDFSPEAWEKIRADCKKFMEEQAVFLEATEETDYGKHGHNFWLTRNHHGTGFWDRGYDRMVDHRNVGEVLTDAAHEYGEDCPWIELTKEGPIVHME